MKFRDIVGSEIIDLKYLAPYIKFGSTSDEMVLIEFDKSEEEEVIKAYLKGLKEKYKKHFFEMSNYFECDDGYFYRFTEEGLKKTDKKAKNFEKHYIKMIKRKSKDACYTKKRLAQYNENTCKEFPSISGFRYGEFVDKNNGACISYRLKKSRKENSPVVIYFHGGGCLGRNNIKPLGEFFLYNVAKGIRGKGCTVLIPQAPRGTSIGLDRNRRHINTVHELVKEICDKVKADRKRIYIVGTSFGGGCVWQYAFMHPETVAAAVPVMGGLSELLINPDVEFGEMIKVPFWVAHAHDDEVVDIEDDDFCVEKIREAGGEAKYTRTATYGHKLANVFYKREDWADWMFEKTK